MKRYNNVFLEISNFEQKIIESRLDNNTGNGFVKVSIKFQFYTDPVFR